MDVNTPKTFAEPRSVALDDAIDGIIQSNQIKIKIDSNQIKSNQIKSNQIKSNQIRGTLDGPSAGFFRNSPPCGGFCCFARLLAVRRHSLCGRRAS
jgi:hypothetical protein